MRKKEKLIYLSLTSGHLLKNYIAKRFNDAGLGITPTHSTMLFLLKKTGPMPMNRFSEELHIENPTVTGLIQRLEKKKFVRREQAEYDRRKWIISLTDKGLREAGEAEKIISSINDEIGDGFTEEEIRIFTKILKSFFIKFKEQSM